VKKQVATVTAATGRIAAAAQIDPSCLLGVAMCALQGQI